MEVTRYVTLLESHGRALHGRAAAAGLDTMVPTCPEWQVRELVQHVGNVHRWAHAFVSTGRTAPPSSDDDEGLFDPVPDDRLLARYDEGLAQLLVALRAAPSDLECWTFLPSPSPLAFWARRQCHETTVHAADAAIAAGLPVEVEPDLAVDGIDELLCGFYSRPRSRLMGEPAFSLSVVAEDARRTWTVHVDQAAVSVDEHTDGDCRLTGTAADLYLFLWNRAPATRLVVDGERTVLDEWAARARVVWS